LLEDGRVDLQRGHAQRLDGNPGEREHAALGRDGRPEADCVRGFCALDGCHARREVQRGGLARGRQELQADRHIRLAEAAHHRLQFRDETGDGRDRLIAEGDRRQRLVVHQHCDLLPFLDQSQRLNVLVGEGLDRLRVDGWNGDVHVQSLHQGIYVRVREPQVDPAKRGNGPGPIGADLHDDLQGRVIWLCGEDGAR